MKKLLNSMTIKKIITFCLLVIGFNCQALEHSDRHKKIMQLGETYVLNQLKNIHSGDISVTAMPIDNRIVIPRCPNSFDVFASPNSLQQSNVTVKVTCAAQDWFLYFVVKVSEIQQVVVATSALSPGSVISQSDVTLTEMDKNTLRNSTFTRIDDIIGARSKRRLISGQPITPNQLCFVCKGDEITITAQGGGIYVKATGIAQQDGNLGEQIQVKNQRSERIITAQVENTSEVTVRL